jgi:hypothetical protein
VNYYVFTPAHVDETDRSTIPFRIVLAMGDTGSSNCSVVRGTTSERHPELFYGVYLCIFRQERPVKDIPVEKVIRDDGNIDIAARCSSAGAGRTEHDEVFTMNPVFPDQIAEKIYHFEDFCINQVRISRASDRILSVFAFVYCSRTFSGLWG